MTHEERQRQIEELLDYYENKPEEVIRRRLAARFSDPAALKLSTHYRNITRAVIEQSALIFQEPPSVTFNSEQHQDTWDELWDEINIPAVLQAIEAYTLLCGSLLVRVDTITNERAKDGHTIEVRLITPNQFCVTPDPLIPTRALEYRIRRFASADNAMPDATGIPGARQPNIRADRESGTDTAFRLRRPFANLWRTGPQKPFRPSVEEVYDVFTYEPDGTVRWTVEDSRGMKRSTEEGVVMNFDPFVAFHSSLPIDEWFAPAALDLLSAENRIVDHLIELGHQLRLNAFSVPIISGHMKTKGGVVVIDPSIPLQKPIDDEGKEVTPLEYASPENDYTLQTLGKAITDETESVYARWSVGIDQKSATSGFMLQVLSAPLMRQVARRRNVTTPSTRQFVRVLMRARGVELESSDFQVEMVESALPEDPELASSELDRIDREIALNLTSALRELMRRNPDLDEDAAKKLLADIRQENEEARGPDPLERLARKRSAMFDKAAGDPVPNDPTLDDEVTDGQ